MIVNEQGKYKLLSDFSDRGTNSIGVIPSDTIIEVTQIDKAYRKVYSPSFSDWVYWDLPVVKV